MPTSNFYLYDSRSTLKTLIVLHFHYNSSKLVFSTRQKALPKFWNKNRQRLKEVTQCPEAKSINQILSKIDVDVNNIYRELILTDITPSNELLSERLKARMKIDSCRVKTPQITRLDFFTMMDKWIGDSYTMLYRVYSKHNQVNYFNPIYF
jgi:hypothetical protein